MSLFARVDWAALDRLMQPVRALLNEDLVSLGHEPREARLAQWQELDAVRLGLKGLPDASGLPAEVEVRCRGELALAALRLAASFQPSPDAAGLPGVTDRFNPEELELVRGLEECKALDVLDASEVERLLRRGGCHPVLEKLARGQYQRLHELLDSSNVRKDVLAGVHAVYQKRLEVLEQAVKAYLARRVETEGIRPGLMGGPDPVRPEAGGGAPGIVVTGGTVIMDGVQVHIQGGKRASEAKDG